MIEYDAPPPGIQYVILDESGAKLTAFATNDNPLIYCQQGKYIAYIGEGDIPDVSVQEPWVYLSVKPDAPMSMGDTMDIHTGHVTPAPQPDPPPDPPPEEIVEGLA